MTGNGKTALPKALAKLLYGDNALPLIIEMGKVSSKFQLPQVFEKLEAFLERNKEGVLVFDEMGNAGGLDLGAKEEIAKAFYSLLDEGIYYSESKQKAYHLKNYTIIFTGNEAEKLFAGYSQPDMLRAIWAEYKTEEQVRAYLRSRGLPDAFIARIGTTILMEPPTTETKQLVAQKFVNDWRVGIEKEQPVKITYDDSFGAQLSDRTYTSAGGARSMLSFVESTMSNLAAEGIFEVDMGQASKANPALVKIWFETKAPTAPFYKGMPEKHLAVLHVTVTQNGEVIYAGKNDFTENAQFMKQIRQTDAFATAFHEAGHAILNDPRNSGRVLKHLTIIPADMYLGYARYESIPNFLTNHTRKTLVARLATLVAGSEAEKLVGRDINSGQSGDIEQERGLITHAAVRWGFVPELQGAIINADGEAVLSLHQQELFDQFANEVLTEARTAAKAYLIENWHLESKVARELIKNGEISGERVEELKKESAALTPEQHQAYFEKYGPEQIEAAFIRHDEKYCNLLMNGKLKAK